MTDAITDALLDSIKLLPFLFLAYLLMETLESKAGAGARGFVRKAGRLGPLLGGLLGLVPQCGFSAAAANLYAGRVITLGTLLSVFLSSSDEMLPILLSERAPIGTVVRILAIKLALGVSMGFAVDALLRMSAGRQAAGTDEALSPSAAGKKVQEQPYQIERLCEHEHCGCHEGGIVRAALRHTVHIFLFVLLITLALNLLLAGIGEEALYAAVGKNAPYGELLAALLGLVPNCAASVAITQLYLRGVFGIGQLIAGLLTGAGVGLLVLFRVNQNLRENLRIAALLYALGVLGGLLVRGAAALW